MYTKLKAVVLLLFVLGMISGTGNTTNSFSQKINPILYYDNPETLEMRNHASKELQGSIDEFYKELHQTNVALDERKREQER